MLNVVTWQCHHLLSRNPGTISKQLTSILLWIIAKFSKILKSKIKEQSFLSGAKSRWHLSMRYLIWRIFSIINFATTVLSFTQPDMRNVHPRLMSKVTITGYCGTRDSIAEISKTPLLQELIRVVDYILILRKRYGFRILAYSSVQKKLAEPRKNTKKEIIDVIFYKFYLYFL